MIKKGFEKKNLQPRKIKKLFKRRSCNQKNFSNNFKEEFTTRKVQ